MRRGGVFSRGLAMAANGAGGAFPFDGRLSPGVTLGYPLFVETLAEFNSAGFGVPDGYANHEVAGQTGNYEILLAVTGAAGATTLTVNSGALEDCGVTTAWAAVVEHDDGTYGTHTVTSIDTGGSTLVVRPPLRGAVTAGTLANLHSSPLGQHWTPTGYRALAEHLWRYDVTRAVRHKWIAQHAETTASDGPWTLTGITAARVDGNVLGNYFVSASANSSVASSRNKRFWRAVPTAAGQSISWTVDLGGRSGYLDTYVGAATDSGSVQVDVTIDSVSALSASYYGLQRVVVPFTAASTGTITLTFADGDAGASHTYRVGTTTWWEVPDDAPAEMFPAGSSVVYCGDSWGAYYDGVGPATLAALLEAENGSLTNVSVEGKDAQWAIDNFDTLITAHSPDIAVLEFFTNDHNTLGTEGWPTWKGNIETLIARCLARGIQPIVVMPAPTASQAQAADHAYWAANLAEGSAL